MTAKRHAFGFYLLLGGFVFLPLLGLVLAVFTPTPLFEAPELSYAALGSLLLKTFFLAFTVTALALPIGTWLAMVTTRFNVSGRRFLSILTLAPLALPSYVLAAILRESLAPRGVLGKIVGQTEAFTGFWAAVFVLVISCSPYVFLLVSAALMRCPVQEEQAAQGLGASGWDVFRYVLMPRLRGPLIYSALLVSLYVVSDFGAVAVLDCDVLTWALYSNRNSSNAFLIGLVLLTSVLPLIGLMRIVRAEEKQDFGIDSNPRKLERLSLKQGFFTFAIFLVTIGLGVFLPVFVLMGWLIEGVANDVQFTNLLSPLLTTGLYAFLGTIVTVMICVALCWRIHSRRLNRMLLDLLVYLPSSLPGVLVAVGLLQLVVGLRRFGESVADVIGVFESAGIVLIFGYVARFLAQAYAALRPGFNRLDGQVEEAARSLGASDWSMWRHIRIPSLSPSIAVAFALTFLSISKELPITLTLVPLGERTIAYHIFDAQAEGALPDVGLASGCLIVMILLMQGITQYWRRTYG